MKIIYLKHSLRNGVFLIVFIVLIILTVYLICVNGNMFTVKNDYKDAIVYHSSPWEEWMDTKLFRHPSKRGVNYASLKDDDVSVIWSPDKLSNLLESSSRNCKRLVSIGGTWDCKTCKVCGKDGHKYVCMDPDVAPVPRDCVVYAFGVGDEMTFDKKMVLFNCSVYAFDMSLVNKTNNVLEDQLHLMTLGLYPKDVNAKYSMHSEDNLGVYTTVNAAFRTLANIRSILDQEDRTIDILKMDVEFSEWSIFESLFLTQESLNSLKNVKQIAIEIHLDEFKNSSVLQRVNAGQRYEQVLSDLKSHDYHLVHTELNAFFQIFADVRDRIFPLFRESLYILRPSL